MLGGKRNMTDDFIQSYRKSDYEIDSIYLHRWSSRAFLDKKVPKDILYSLFEAARWAPSANNVQPWRFIIAKKDEDRKKFLTFMNQGNITWCQHAPVLVAIISHTKWVEGGRDINPTNAFDTGTAWGFLALEATRKGLVAHAMGGFNREKAKEVLNIPEDFDVHAIVAIGYRGDKNYLPEDLQVREKPSNRRKITEFTFEGTFNQLIDE